MINSTRPNLLHVIADRLDGTAPLPSAVDGLQAPHCPRLVFHDVLDDELSPWLERFGASFVWSRERSLPGAADFTVTRWLGNYFGTPVEIELYRKAT